MRVPLVVKIIGFLLLAVLVVSASTWMLLQQQEARVVAETQRRNVELLVHGIHHGVAASMVAGNKDVARAMVDELAAGHEIERVVIYDNVGGVWHDSQTGSSEPLVPARKVASVAKTGKDEFVDSTSNGESLFVAVSPIPAQEACFRCHKRSANLGAIGVALSTAEYRAALVRDRRTLVFSSTAAGAAATIVLGLMLTLIVVAPIRRLSGTAKSIAEGHLELRSNIRSRDEIGDLAGAFNTMTSHLEHQINDLEATRAELQETIERVGQAISSAHKLDELADVLAREAVRIAKMDAAAALLFSEQGDLVVVGAHGLSVESLAAYNARPLRRSDEAVAELGARSVADEFDPEADSGRARAAILPGARSNCVIPIMHESRVLGFISVSALAPTRIEEDARRLLYALASQAGLAVDQIRMNEQTKIMAITDGLTGLYNHRYFQERLAAEFERARRFNHPLSVIMIDVDHFKRFNDRHGHIAGDAVLEGLGTLLHANARRVDVAARYGGEEFAIVLVETAAEEALAFAERLRGTVESTLLAETAVPDGHVTVSIGVATNPPTAGGPESLLEAADRGLYEAKAQGRNRVCVVGDSAGAPDDRSASA